MSIKESLAAKGERAGGDLGSQSVYGEGAPRLSSCSQGDLEKEDVGGLQPPLLPSSLATWGGPSRGRAGAQGDDDQAQVHQGQPAPVGEGRAGPWGQGSVAVTVCSQTLC